MASVPDIVPISDLRQDAAGVIKRAATSQKPVFITQRGRAAAVMVSAQSYARTQRELEILRLLARGEAEIEAGVGHDLDTVLAEADDLLGRA
ncbi:MAG TPA: type II toxin-antitoxin system Phd/YefM family antitoxin [Thermoleophilia bacterium]|nr:type II toxin-antitoxin system Phd/YefM family antitoxin [Thermoleophilia bacterium]